MLLRVFAHFAIEVFVWNLVKLVKSNAININSLLMFERNISNLSSFFHSWHFSSDCMPYELMNMILDIQWLEFHDVSF